MNDQRFDDLARRIGRALRGEHTRRTVLKGAGATIATGGAVCGAMGPASAHAARLQTTPASDPLIQQIAFDLEYDLEKIFRFVADEIGYETYNGALRGVRGTIWSRAGNSVDKAQVLKALLDEALIESRFAFGELADDDAAALAETSGVRREQSAVLDAALEFMADDAPRPTAVPTDELPADPSEVIERLGTMREELIAEATETIQAHAEELTALLTDADVEVLTVESGLAGLERERYVWLQARQGPEWLDLNPAFADSEAGQAPASAIETAAEFAADLFHTLTFRVIAEVATAEATEEQTMLDYTVRSQDLVGGDVLILHVAPESLEAIGTSITGALSGQVTSYPVIVLGDEGFIADTPIVLGGSGGVLGEDVLGGEEQGATPGEALAERYEIEIASPGMEPVAVSRTIFDRIPAAQRAAGEIALEDIPKVEVIDLGNGERGVPEVKRVIALATVVSDVDAAYMNQPIAEETHISYYTGAVHGLHAIRELLDDELSTLPSTFYDRPNLAAYTMIPIPVGDGGNPGVRLEADLLAQGYAFAAGVEGTAPGIYAGVLAQQAEKLALSHSLLGEMYAVGALPVDPEVPQADVQSIFAAARGDDIEILVLQPDDDADNVDVDDVTRERLDALLAGGKVVIVPQRPVDLGEEAVIGWWVYDPATGELYDQLPDGRSGATLLLGPMAEYAKKLWVFTKTTKGFLALGSCIAAVLRATASLIQQEPGRAGASANVSGNVYGAGFACAAYAAGPL